MGRCIQYLLPLLFISFIQHANSQTEDYFCGVSFLEVRENCILPCPTGADSVCTSALGSDYGCYYFTGCAEKIANGFVPDTPGGLIDVETEQPSKKPTPSPTDAAVITPAPVDPVVTPAPADAVVTAAPTPQPIEEANDTPSPVVATVDTPNPTEEVFQSAPTNKPTRRTKRPTPPPVSAPVAISTPNPTKPSVTSSPTSSTMESISTATTDELNGSSSTTSTSYGFIFSLRTTAEAPVMEVVGFDFLTASTSTLNFELYTKPGSYSGSKVSYYDPKHSPNYSEQCHILQTSLGIYWQMDSFGKRYCQRQRAW